MKKGFFFSVVSLILLIYIFSSISYKMDYIKEQNEAYKEQIRLSSYEFVFSQLNEKSIDSYIEVAYRYALSKLAYHTSKYPIKPSGDESTDMDNLKSILDSLAQKGYADSSYFSSKYFSPSQSIQYTNDEIEKTTFEGLKDKLSESLSKNGLSLDYLSVSLDSIEMKDSFNVEFKGVINMKVSDIFSSSEKTIAAKHFDIVVPIESMYDPLVMRYLKKEGPFDDPNTASVESLTPGRYIYPSTDGVVNAPEELLGCNVEGSNSWFYGEVVDVDDADHILHSKAKFYILAGSYDDITNYPKKDDFGAYLFTDMPVSFGFSKPYVIITNYGSCMSKNKDIVKNNNKEYAILFISIDDSEPSSDTKVFGMENFRDDVLCGYYFSSSSNSISNNGKAGAPSFLQRMFVDGYDRVDDKNGIFSFLVGREYGGDMNPSEQDNSKLDFEFVKQWDNNNGDSIPIRGMPACKDSDTCSSSPDETFVPRFSLSELNILSLGLDEVSCPENSVGWGVDCD